LVVEKATAFVERLSNVPGCGFEKQSVKYKLISHTGVRWGRGNKWGNIHFDKEYLYVALDYPTNAYDVDTFAKRLGLSVKNPGERKSGIYVRRGDTQLDTPGFDSLRVSLYEDVLRAWDSFSDSLIDVAVEIFHSSKR
jgi:hypothetical protein